MRLAAQIRPTKLWIGDQSNQDILLGQYGGMIKTFDKNKYRDEDDPELSERESDKDQIIRMLQDTYPELEVEELGSGEQGLLVYDWNAEEARVEDNLTTLVDDVINLTQQTVKPQRYANWDFRLFTVPREMDRMQYRGEYLRRWNELRRSQRQAAPIGQ